MVTLKRCGACALLAAKVSLFTAGELQAQGVERGPWGEERDVALALGEILGVMALGWSYNRVKGSDASHVSPASWARNIDGGFVWDPNTLQTNMLSHPLQGAAYYNAGRSNGLTYWESTLLAATGSLIWECCGETNPMSLNDQIATSLGGAALGEAMYRVSSSVLDNTATGAARVWREIAGAAIDPIRGFSRLVSGRASRVYANPEDPYDRARPLLRGRLSTGLRLTHESGSIDDDTDLQPFIRGRLRFGSPFAGGARKPFSFIDMSMELIPHLRFCDHAGCEMIRRFRIHGHVFADDLEQSDRVHHVLAVTHNLDYLNDQRYQLAGQSLGAALLSNWRLGDTWSLFSHLEVDGYPLNAVNAGPPVVRVPGRDQHGPYDMGVGAGLRLHASLDRAGRELMTVGYELTWIHGLSDSNDTGDSANHVVQLATLGANVPVGRALALGAELALFTRDSYFNAAGFADASQSVPEARILLTWGEN